MASDNLFHVSVPNWHKFNPRADRANHSWFRFENDFFSDQRVFGLSGDVQRLFIFICALRSKTSKECVEVCTQYASAILRIPQEAIQDGMTRLNEASLIVTQERGTKPSSRRRKAVIEPAQLLTTNERTNDTNERTLEHDDIGGVPPPSTAITPDEILVQDFKDFLATVPFTAIRAWLEAYGEPFVREQIPKIRAAWESDEVRKRAGGKPLFVRHWLQNEQKQREKNPPPPVPSAPPGTNNAAFDRLKKELAEVDANPPDPDRVRKMLRGITGG